MVGNVWKIETWIVSSIYFPYIYLIVTGYSHGLPNLKIRYQWMNSYLWSRNTKILQMLKHTANRRQSELWSCCVFFKGKRNYTINTRIFKKWIFLIGNSFPKILYYRNNYNTDGNEPDFQVNLLFFLLIGGIQLILMFYWNGAGTETTKQETLQLSKKWLTFTVPRSNTNLFVHSKSCWVKTGCRSEKSFKGRIH